MYKTRIAFEDKEGGTKTGRAGSPLRTQPGVKKGVTKADGAGSSR